MLRGRGVMVAVGDGPVGGVRGVLVKLILGAVALVRLSPWQPQTHREVCYTCKDARGETPSMTSSMVAAVPALWPLSVTSSGARSRARSSLFASVELSALPWLRWSPSATAVGEQEG